MEAHSVVWIVWLSLALALAVSHLLALYLFFFPRLCRHRFRPNSGFGTGFRP
jgi:hypothetical protein